MFRRRLKNKSGVLTAALAVALPIYARASIVVEQIEAETSVGGKSPNYTYMGYAPIDLGGLASVTVQSGTFAGITFHAVDTANDTNTGNAHAANVGGYFYSAGTVANPFVTDVYCYGADDFLNSSTLGTQNDTGVGPLPGSLPAGVQVVNNSWIDSYQNGTDQTYDTDLDAQRRYDYIVTNADAVSVAGAADGNTYNGSAGTGEANPLLWACYDTIAVTGQQPFSPAGNPTKQHSDISELYIDASYACGTLSGYATALLGTAQAASQSSAMHSAVVRSLLFAGTDKVNYSNPGGGSLGGMDPVMGSGQMNFNTSLSILQGGQRTLSLVGSNSAFSATPATVQKGWSYGTIGADTQDVVLIQSANALTGVTASLNWNVTSQTSGGNINTSTSALIFPNLTLEFRPATYNSSLGKYVLGAAESSNLFRSSVSQDNTQYISTTLGVPAGTYALVVTGDPQLSASVGLSYTLSGSFASQWNSSAGGSWQNASLWTNGIPNGAAAQANFLSSPGFTSPATITMDGYRVVGQMTFNNPNGCTIALGTIPSGQLGRLDFSDTGDSTGNNNPLVTVVQGTDTINAPIFTQYGLTTNISAGSSLTLGSWIYSPATFVKTGAGTLSLGGAVTGSLAVNGGTAVLSTAANFSNGGVSVTGGTLNLTAPTSGGLLDRAFPGVVAINAGGAVVLNPASVTANRQLLVATGGLSIAGSKNSWLGKLDLNNNDADLPSASLSNVSNQVLEGFNKGNWNGAGGIVSTSAANNPQHLTALGVIQNNQSGSALFNSSNGFDGTTPGASDILIKYTYYGDANLSGKVDSADYTLIDSGYLTHATGWFNGDFNYDGVVNGSDYTLIDNAFNTQGAQILDGIANPAANVTTEIASSVPEPTGLGALLVAGSLLLGRSRRGSVC